MSNLCHLIMSKIFASGLFVSWSICVYTECLLLSHVLRDQPGTDPIVPIYDKQTVNLAGMFLREAFKKKNGK